MHPFSDQSGVAFYRPDTTVITSIGLPLNTIQAMLDSPDLDKPETQKVLHELEHNGFIEKIAQQ
ncbi:hypothetical protein [Glaciecola sp. SC05]|uniref:hypothetical protein n=1 Tax=Glaciecola sp. SC05 TaxID=1987355 RepID=UPI0035276BED